MTAQTAKYLLSKLSVASAILLLGMAIWLKAHDRVGHNLVVESAHRALKGSYDGQHTSLEFSIRNLSDRAIRLIGVDDRCTISKGCSTTHGLPLTITPAKLGVVRVDFVSGVSPFQFVLTIMTDEPSQPQLQMIIEG